MLPRDFVKPTQPILTVSEFTQAIKKQLEASFSYVLLKGEVSNFRKQSSGHLYFSLKDADAQISAVMFRGQAAELPILPKEGDEVFVKGSLTLYAPRGTYQIVISSLEWLGAGALLQRLEALKRELHKRGWFRTEHKKPLPPFPKTIGVITSPTGAAIQDILHILRRRADGFHLLLNPVRVQGEEASREIAQAIRDMNTYRLCDVLIVGRGGGSIEDLWAFNEEVVARAIFESEIPIIGAVGHETDHCIAEYVADIRAPTPSAAAEIVLAEKRHQLDFLAGSRLRIQHLLHTKIVHSKQRVAALRRHPFLASPHKVIDEWFLRIDDKREQIDALMQNTLQRYRWRLEGHQRHLLHLSPLRTIDRLTEQLLHHRSTLQWQLRIHLRRSQERFGYVYDLLQAVNPKNLLTRGYSILFSKKENSVIKSVKNLHKGQAIEAVFSDGTATFAVMEIEAHER